MVNYDIDKYTEYANSIDSDQSIPPLESFSRPPPASVFHNFDTKQGPHSILCFDL